jgi:16S rRNA (adenine(1408)-N(1))-methyltransferase
LSPATFFVGIDPVQSAMIDASRRAGSKPHRGGLANAMFVQSSLESLPAELDALTDEITINYPWGSLLRAVAMPNGHLLSKLAAIARRGAQLELYVNIHPLQDVEYAARFGLSDTLLMTCREAFGETYARAGLVVTEVAEVEGNPSATTWEKRLARGSRRILRIRATRS